MKKLLFLLLAILTVALFASCSSEKTEKPTETTFETVFETLNETDLPEETEKNIIPETIIETKAETEVEKSPEKQPIKNDFAILNVDDLSTLNDYHAINVAERYIFWEYSLMYSAKKINNASYDRGKLLLPEGYTDGSIFSVKIEETEKLVHVYTAAKKDGQNCLFDYMFRVEGEETYPVSRMLLDEEKTDSIIKTKNTFSDKIFNAFDSYRTEDTYGDFVLEMPVAFSEYWVSVSRVVYCNDGVNLANAALVITSGYATVYPLEEYELYTAENGWKYETRKFRWCRSEANINDDDYYKALPEYNKRDFMYMMKITDNYYVFVDIHYKDQYAPPANAEQTVENILKQIKVEISK